MRYSMVIALVILLTGFTNGYARNYFRGYERPMYVGARSRQSPSRYRSEDIDESLIEEQCDQWSRRMDYFENTDHWWLTARTVNGIVCLKEQASVKIITWCTESEYYNNRLDLVPSIVNRRKSHISTCEIYDVEFTGQYISISTGKWEKCFVRLLNGVISCVEDDEILPESKILTLYPKLDPYVNYYICSVSLGSYCPEPLKFMTTVEKDQESSWFSYPAGIGR